jgi:hypothetical protein
VFSALRFFLFHLLRFCSSPAAQVFTMHTSDVTLQVIRELLDVKKFVIVVEHDLSVLDYLSDFICCLYGKPGAYGVVTLPFGVRYETTCADAGFWVGMAAGAPAPVPSLRVKTPVRSEMKYPPIPARTLRVA